MIILGGLIRSFVGGAHHGVPRGGGGGGGGGARDEAEVARVGVVVLVEGDALGGWRDAAAREPLEDVQVPARGGLVDLRGFPVTSSSSSSSSSGERARALLCAR